MKMFFYLLLVLNAVSSRALALIDFHCHSNSGYCLEVGGMENSDRTIQYATSFSTSQSSFMIPTPNEIFLAIPNGSSTVTVVTGSQQLPLGIIGAAQDSYHQYFELVLNPGVSFEAYGLQTGERVVCSRSALGLTQKWVTPVEEVQVTAKNSAQEITFKAIVDIGPITNDSGFLGGLTCRNGISWN